MNKFFKSKVFIFAICVAFLSTVLAHFAIYNAQNTQQANSFATQTTSLQVKVVSLDDTPIKNAKVFVAETQQTFYTDLHGYTTIMQVPFVDTPLCKVTDGEFSFVNLAITCDGFKDVVLFNCVVFKNRTRQGPVVMMFDKNQTNAPFVAITEVPPDKWTKEFLQKIKESY